MRQLYQVVYFLAKWLVCSWLHRSVWVTTNRGELVQISGRCYPRCDVPIGQTGYDYWHCDHCHPCGEELDIIFGRGK